MKKTIQINVRMTETDLALLLKAAKIKWPGAEITRSGIVLSLARITAKKILGQRS